MACILICSPKLHAPYLYPLNLREALGAQKKKKKKKTRHGRRMAQPRRAIPQAPLGIGNLCGMGAHAQARLGEQQRDGEALRQRLLNHLLGDHHRALRRVYYQKHAIRQPHRRADLVIEVDMAYAHMP